MNRVTMNIIILIISINIHLNTATVDPRTLDLQQIRERLQLLKQTLSDGVTLSELQSLRDIIVGISSEEAGELEKEIDALLNEPFDLEQELLGTERTTVDEQDISINSYVDPEKKSLQSTEQDILNKANKNENSEIETHLEKETVVGVESDFVQQLQSKKSSNINIGSDEIKSNFSHKNNDNDMKIKNNFLKWNKTDAASNQLKENFHSSSKHEETDKSSNSAETVKINSNLGVNLASKDTQYTEKKIELEKNFEEKDDKDHDQMKIDKVKDAVNLKADILKDTIDLKADNVKSSVDWKADLLKEAVEWKSDKIKSSVQWGNEKYINITDWSKNKYDDAIKKAQVKHDTASEIKNSFREKVSDSIEWGTDKVKDSVEKIGNVSREFIEEKKDVAKKIKTTAHDVKKTISDKVQDSLEWGTDKIQSSVELGENVYKKFVEEKKEATEKIKETANKAITTINDTVQGSLEFGSQKVKDFVQLAKQKTDAAKETKQSVLDSVKDTIKQVEEKTKDSVQGAYVGIIHSAWDKNDAIQDIKYSSASIIQDTNENTKEKVVYSTEKSTNKVKDSISWKKNKFGKAQLDIEDKMSLEHKKVNATSETNIVTEKPKIIEQIQHIKLVLPTQNQDKEKGSKNWLDKKLTKKSWKNEDNGETKIDNGVMDSENNSKNKWKSKGIFFNLWGGKENESLVKKPTLENQKTKENLKMNSSQISRTVSITIKQTSVKTNPVVIYHTETTIGKIKTLTVTSTVLKPSTVILEDVVTIAGRPELLTKTISFTETKVHTVDTLLPKVEWKTKSVVLSLTETDVENQYETIYSDVPVYETVTDHVFRTSLATQMKTHLYESTLTITRTQLVEIPVSVTQTKSRTVEQLVIETIFKDKTVTELSTVEQTKTKIEKCKKGFFDDIKKFG